MPIRVFPVAGGASYTNDWHAARGGGERSHEGNDLFAAEGTPLLAVEDGEVRFGDDPRGGRIASLRASDGLRYYYAHLSGFAGSARPVRAGEVIGYLGRTGNAAHTAPHLHFGVYRSDGSATNPFPMLQGAAVRRAGGAGGRSVLVPLLVASAIGIGYWAWTSPTEARRLGRRWGILT